MTPKEILHVWFGEVWNQSDRKAIDRYLAEPCEVHGLAHEPIRTRNDMKAFFDQMNAVLDDIHIDVDHCIESGNTVAFVFTVNGVHKATGNRFSQKNAGFGTVESSQIVYVVNVVDFLSMFMQTGVLPADAIQQGLSAGRIA